MNDDERQVLYRLGEAFNLFAKLPALHQDDLTEFRQAIHAAQNIVLARPAFRDLHVIGKEKAQ